MSALPWIAAAAGGVGLYLWWRSKQTTAPQDDLCAKLCRASGAYCVDGGASCRETLGILGPLNPFHDSSGNFTSEQSRREANNVKLNGPAVQSRPNVPADPAFGPRVLAGQTLRHQNGCVPYFGAPDFAKCAPGTLDMYGSAIAAGAGGDLAIDESTMSVALGEGPGGAWPSFAIEAANKGRGGLDKDHMMTGSSGDPSTRGPFDSTNPFWYVRGKKVSCPAGKAPRSVLLQQYGDMLADDSTGGDCLGIFDDPRVNHTQGGCPPPPGVTWRDGAWRPLKPGESVNLGPCVVGGTGAGPLDALSHFLGFK